MGFLSRYAEGKKPDMEKVLGVDAEPLLSPPVANFRDTLQKRYVLLGALSPQVV
jgi:hypothetical protein